LQSLQFRAEMAQYKKIMENVHAIAERERQRQHQESDLAESDNKLSALPSSVFNGMDGICCDIPLFKGLVGSWLTPDLY
jgi:hypothetical protein